MKYCPIHLFRYPDDRTTCKACGALLVEASSIQNLPEDVTVKLYTLCCPSPDCEDLLAPPKKKYCAGCGVKLLPISCELWADKYVKPALEKRLGDVLLDPSDLFRPVAEMGLSRNEARQHLDILLEERLGVGREVLDGWLQETAGLLKDKQKAEAAQQRAIREAQKLHIALYDAAAIVERLAQSIETSSESPSPQPVQQETPLAQETPIVTTPPKGEARVYKLRKNRSVPIISESDSSQSSARSFYRNLVSGRPVSRHLTYLNLEAKQASQILNESKDLYLKEVADNAGIFVLFADSKEQGWVFPNPRLRKLEPELQALFPHLTKAVLDHTETYVEPVLVRYVSDGRWKVEFNGSSAFHNEKIESPTIVEPTREAFNNSVINGTTTSAKPAPEVTPRAATEAAPSRKPRVEFKSLVNRNRSTIIPGLLLGVGIFIIIAVVLLGISRLLDRIGNQNANIPNANSSPTPQPSPPPPAKPSPPGMAYVQGGDFMMGNNEGGNELEKPEHKVNVPAFYIDKYEVTCEQYAKFVKESNHPAPPGWINGNYPSGAAKLPVTGVSWYDAKAYARWAGKRLPSEAEWELAARGYDKRLYPWGNVWKLNAANAGETSAGRIVEVGSYKDGLSPAEAYDMIGNVWEWTSSELTSYTPRQPLPATLANGRPVVRGKVIRGGGWASKGIFATTTYRIGYQPEGEKSLYLNTGFRCAMDAPP